MLRLWILSSTFGVSLLLPDLLFIGLTVLLLLASLGLIVVCDRLMEESK